MPLGDPEKSVMDPKLIGWWQAAEPGTVLNIAAYDKRTYVVTLYAYKGDANAPKADTKFTTKAWMTTIGGMDIMTFQIIDAEWELQGGAEAAAKYNYYRIRNTDAGAIEATPLNTDFLKDTKTPEELAKKIADNEKNPELLKSSDTMVLKPVPDDKKEDLKKIVAAFGPVKG